MIHTQFKLTNSLWFSLVIYGMYIVSILGKGNGYKETFQFIQIDADRLTVYIPNSSISHIHSILQKLVVFVDFPLGLLPLWCDIWAALWAKPIALM